MLSEIRKVSDLLDARKNSRTLSSEAFRWFIDGYFIDIETKSHEQYSDASSIFRGMEGFTIHDENDTSSIRKIIVSDTYGTFKSLFLLNDNFDIIGYRLVSNNKDILIPLVLSITWE